LRVQGGRSARGVNAGVVQGASCMQALGKQQQKRLQAGALEPGGAGSAASAGSCRQLPVFRGCQQLMRHGWQPARLAAVAARGRQQGEGNEGRSLTGAPGSQRSEPGGGGRSTPGGCRRRGRRGCSWRSRAAPGRRRCTQTWAAAAAGGSGEGREGRGEGIETQASAEQSGRGLVQGRDCYSGRPFELPTAQPPASHPCSSHPPSHPATRPATWPPTFHIVQ
jgi:hypothetical protein